MDPKTETQNSVEKQTTEDKIETGNKIETTNGIKLKTDTIKTTTDNNPQLESDEFRQMINELGIKHHIDIVPKLELAETSCGGRIRVSALVTDGALKYVDRVITVGGWARTIKEQGKGSFAFVKINDGSHFMGVQVVVNKDMPGFDNLIKQSIGACIQVKGLVVKSQGKEQLIEISCSDPVNHFVRVIGECIPSEYPINKGKDAVKLENLRELGHLRPPIITGADCEGAGEMFQVTTLLPRDGKQPKTGLFNNDGTVDYSNDFFKKDTYLTVSGQLAVENYACALSDVYTFGPTFRAEVSHTTRHLAEFWMIEPEMTFCDIWSDMECAESYLKYCINFVLQNNMDDLKFLEANNEKEVLKKGEKEEKLIDRLKNIVENEFARISYTDAITLLEDV
jgi:asparaginyl-tRNA synthetase